MTTIFAVSFDSVEGSTLRGRVHIVNPDVPYVPEETVFPLSLLVDAWWHLDNGYWHDERDDERGGRCPFTKEQGKDITAGMRLKDGFPKLFELILGKEIRVTEDGYLLADDGKTVLEPRRKAEDVYKLSGAAAPAIPCLLPATPRSSHNAPPTSWPPTARTRCREPSRRLRAERRPPTAARLLPPGRAPSGPPGRRRYPASPGPDRPGPSPRPGRAWDG